MATIALKHLPGKQAHKVSKREYSQVLDVQVWRHGRLSAEYVVESGHSQGFIQVPPNLLVVRLPHTCGECDLREESHCRSNSKQKRVGVSIVVTNPPLLVHTSDCFLVVHCPGQQYHRG